MISGAQSVLLACETLKDETEEVFSRPGKRLPVRYLPVRHDRPADMRAMLTRTIDEHADADFILLAYGYCGGGLEGIGSPSSTLVVPKVHDCIDCLLTEEHRNADFRTGRYFLTRGWLRGKKNLPKKLKALSQSLGEKRSAEYIKTVYGGYRSLTLLDDGAYPIKEVFSPAKEAAGMLNLPVEQVNGTLSRIEKLITGRWDEDFLIAAPGQCVKREALIR